jgi:putative exporter of polyketide antibiotics
MYGAPPPNHRRAVLILVLGILSLVCCGLFTGIPAWVMGNSALREIDSSNGAIGGRGMVQAGRICGIIGVVVSILGIIARIALFSNN